MPESDMSPEQLERRLANPKNLANRFKRGKIISNEQAIIEREFSEPNLTEAEYDARASKEITKTVSEDLPQESVQHREIKRPGNNRPWLSKQDRTRIAADYAASTGNFNKVGQKEIAQRYGVAISTVSDIVNGKRRALDTSRSIDPTFAQSLQAKVDLELDQVRERAIDRLMAGLGQLTDDKISAHNAKDVSVICANMAKVVQQTIPQEKTAQQINLIVYTPEIRNEGSFDIVEVE